MTNSGRIWALGIAAGIFAAILFLAQDILLPFVAGIAVAYFLDPVADRIESWGASRLISTVIITAGFFALLIALAFLLVPLLQGQIIGLAGKLPALAERLIDALAPLREALRESLSAEDADKLRGVAGTYAGSIIKWAAGIVQGLFRGGAALLNLLSLLIITPLVSFYLLRDWDRIVATIDGWVPRKWAPEVRQVVTEIDKTLAGFARGQATVSLILAVIYGAGLTLVGLDFGLLVGLATGLISFIPYFGMLIGLIIAFAIAFVQFSEPLPFVLIAAVFAAGQIVESFFLTPKLVGERVGLHPVWVIFALLAGGAGFGFTGILLAVPVAAALGVLARHFLGRYQASAAYQEGGGGGSESGDGGE